MSGLRRSLFEVILASCICGVTSLGMAQNRTLEKSATCLVKIQRPAAKKGKTARLLFSPNSTINILKSSPKNPDLVLFSSSESKYKGEVYQGSLACLTAKGQGQPAFLKNSNNRKEDKAIGGNDFGPSGSSPLGAESVLGFKFQTFSQSLVFTHRTENRTENLVSSILGFSLFFEDRYRWGDLQGRWTLGTLMGLGNVSNDGAVENYTVATNRALLLGAPAEIGLNYVVLEAPSFLISAGPSFFLLTKYQKFNSTVGSFDKSGLSFVWGSGLTVLVYPAKGFSLGLTGYLNELRFSRFGLGLNLDYLF